MQGLDWVKQGVWSVLFCIATGVFFLGGAEAAVTWERSYAGIPYNRTIEATADGGYASVGIQTNSPSVLKFDALGNVEWHRKYSLANAGGYFFISSLKSTRDGGFILCGKKSETTYSAWVMKLDGGGNVLWTRSYNLTANYYRNVSGIVIHETEDGGFILLAEDTINTISQTLAKNLWLVKLDEVGDIQWQKTLSSNEFLYAHNLYKTRDGAFVVTARAGNTNTGKVVVMKLDGNGGPIWAKNYGADRLNLIHSLTELEDGSFALAGTSPMPYPVWEYPWVVKINNTGNIIWQKEYSTDEVRYPVMILPAVDNGFLLAGSETGQHSFMLKLDDAGTAQWSVDLGRGVVFGFQSTVDGGYVLAKPYSVYNVTKLDANAESCLNRNKNYLTTTMEKNLSVADAIVKTAQTDALPVSIAIISEDISIPLSQLYCISALPEIAVDASALDYGFGSVEVLSSAAANVFISNSCGAALNVSAITITGENAGDFTLTTDCSTVVAGGSCTAEVVFAPGTLGAKLGLLTITSDDPKQPKIEIPLSGQAVDTVAPVITLLGQEELTVEAGSAYVDAGTTALDNYDGNLTAAIVTDNPVNSTVVGTYLVTYDVTDASGNRATQLIRTVHVVDTIPPEVSLSVDRSLLWPPNHKLVDILVSGDAQDSGSGLLTVVLSVTDEYGEYNLTLPTFGSTVALEAWRDGQDKDGRVYTLTAVATDRAGNATTRSSNILVPHDLGK